jgi:hypothetical protein
MKQSYLKGHSLAFKLSLILLFAFVALIYSCKKDENTKPHATEASVDKQPEKIEPTEILSWVQNLPFQLPTDPAWDHATQAIINNEFVVKVPVGADAALFFVKKDGVLQAYTYKWLYEKSDGKEFNGNLDIFNFQTMRLDRLVYKNGDNIKTVTLDNAAPAQAPLVQTKQKVNTVDIGRALAKIWCWLTGGTWYEVWGYDFNCVYSDPGPDYGNSTAASDYYSSIFGSGGLPGGGSSTGGNGGGGTWVPDPGTGNCDIKVAVVGNGKLRVQLLPPGDGCPPVGTPYPIPTPTPQTGDKYDAKFVKSVGILKITTIISELENQYVIQLGLTDLEKAQFASQLFDSYKANFNTNFASLQIITDEGADPPFVAWLRNKLGKISGIYPPKDAAETQQITSELGTWGPIGQRILQVRQTVLGRPYNENSPVYVPADFNVVYAPEWFTNEDELGAIGNELQLQGLKNTDPIPESYYKNGTPIDMTPSPIDSRTVKGAPRNAKYFWTQLIKKRPEMFSEDNRGFIAANSFKDIKADDQWLKYNPTHKAYRLGQLVHHHNEQGYTAYAIPAKVHQKWTAILHEFRIKGKIPRIQGTLNSFVNIMQVFSLLTDIQTGNPDAWVNWFGQNNQVGKIYKQPLTGDYYIITKLTPYKNSNGTVIRAVVTYNVYADYIWDTDEGKYMGVQKLATFTEDIDVVNKKSTTRSFQTN